MHHLRAILEASYYFLISSHAIFVYVLNSSKTHIRNHFNNYSSSPNPKCIWSFYVE